MNKKVLLIHRIFFAINLLIWVGCLIYYILKFGSLPDEIGIHFGGNGDFDVIASKVYGFYPHLIGGIITLGLAVAFHIIPKKSSGLKMRGRGEEIFRAEVMFTLDVLHMMCLLLFAFWTRSVSLQVGLPLHTVGNVLSVFLLLIAAGIAAQIVTYIVFREKKKDAKDTMLTHRLSRLIAWLVTFGSVWMLLEVYPRLPGDEKLYFDPDYYGLAYFANLGRYLDKRYLFIPLVAGVVLLIIIEIISVRAVKAEKRSLVRYTDDLRVFTGLFFFFSNMTLCSESKIKPGFLGFFAVLYTIATILFLVRRKKEKTKI